MVPYFENFSGRDSGDVKSDVRPARRNFVELCGEIPGFKDLAPQAIWFVTHYQESGRVNFENDFDYFGGSS
ncbi:MAG: hypothetical protein ABIF88_02615 [archaeon]